MADQKFSDFTNGDDCAIGDQVAGLRASDAGANYRFSFPGSGLRDGDLNYMFQYGSRGAASQNYLKLWNSAASNALEIEALGVAATIDITLTPKGAGSGVNVPTPTQGTHAANKDYADSIASGLSYFLGARLTTIGFFNATYDNGVAGVGATLTATSNGALSFDSTACVLGDAVLVTNQINTYENGLYLVTQVGDASNPGILTRSSHFDTSAKMQRGDSFSIAEGATRNGTVYYLEDPVSVVGTDPVRLLPIQYVTLETNNTITGEKTFSAETFFADRITHAGDTNNFRSFGTDTQDFQTGGSSRLDISDSGVRLGAANARVTTILTDDTLSAAADTNLYTGLALKTYIDNTAGGKVVQIVTDFGGGSATNSATYVDVTSAAATITPTSASNNILMIATGYTSTRLIGGVNQSINIRAVRDSTTIGSDPTVIGRTSSGAGGLQGAGGFGFCYLDSPATTSATTYKLQHKVFNTGSNCSTLAVNIILLEVTP